MKIFFITGNQNKYQEVKVILSNVEVEMLDIDLPEIQSLDSHQIIQHKVTEAFTHHAGPFMVEDTGLYLSGLNGLPGPLVKWFLDTVGPMGIYKLAETFGDFRAEAKATIGFAMSPNEIEFFEGVIPGTIVPPRGNQGFGWDEIFCPNGFPKSFGEMTKKEKNAISHRKLSVTKLSDFLRREQ